MNKPTLKPKARQSAEKIQRSQYIRNLFNLLLVLLGLVIVVQFMSYMQRQYSTIKANQTADNALTAIVETLDENTQKVNALTQRYHMDNQSVLSDIAYLLQTEHYAGLAQMTADEQAGIMSTLSATVGESGALFVIDRSGQILVAPQPQYNGRPLQECADLTDAQLALLTRSASEDGQLLSGTSRTTVAADGTEQMVYEEVLCHQTDVGFEAYLYSRPLTQEYFLVYAVNAAALDQQLNALRDLGPILSSVVVGEGGFVFAVDAATEQFRYYDNGAIQRSGQTIYDSGLTADALANEFNGLQTIDGVLYHCLSRTYSSPFYGKYTVITAVCAATDVFGYDRGAIALTAFVFLLCTGVFILYSSLLRLDPEQLLRYDEHVTNSREAARARKRGKAKSLRNVRVFKLHGEQYYLKEGIAQRLSAVLVIGILLVFAISWNSQMIVEITRGMEQSDTALRQLQVLFSNRDSSSEIIKDRYQNQYLSKIRLISFLLEEDPALLDCLNRDADNVHGYVGDDLEPLYNADGVQLRAAARSEQLIRLARNNGLDYIGVFDDHGHTLATSDAMWYYTLSREAGEQSTAFLDIITGKLDQYIQEPRHNDLGEYMQYVGAPFYYYTLAGDGPAAGRFVSRKEYDACRTDGSWPVDGTAYQVVRHRSVVIGGITDGTISEIMDATSNDALMRQVRVGQDGFVVLFDNTPEHVCVWSPHASSIGRSARELDIADEAFAGAFKGFTTVNGVAYFQSYVFDNGYWVATALPTASMLAGRDPIALVTAAVSALFFLLLFVLCIFSTESEEDMLLDVVEKQLGKNHDNGMVKVEMPSGKFKYVRSAASRFTETAIPWADMSTNQRLAAVLKYALSIIVVLIILVIIFCREIFGDQSAIVYIIHGSWEHGFNYFAVFSFVAVVLCVSAGSFVVTRIINFIIRNMGSRVETVGRLLLSVVKYGSVLFSIFYGLSLLGVSTAGLVTSASIMSIVIGLGAQSLISDILSGIFIVFEGAFRVGDIVTVGDFRGSVVDIGLRTTKIENTTGDIKIFNNSSIAGIINMTKKASKAICRISIEYGADLHHVERILKDALPGIGRRNPKIIDTPMYDGVDELADSSVILRVTAFCAEKDRIEIGRYMNRELFLLFRKHDIGIPFPQVTVSYEHEPESSEPTA